VIVQVKLNGTGKGMKIGIGFLTNISLCLRNDIMAIQLQWKTNRNS